MRILLTNNGLATVGGTELYLCEVAEELQARGHEPMVFSLTLGPLAQRLLGRGIPVTDDLRALPGPPEVIHGQHLLETTLAAMTFRTVPVISFCHGPEAWQESACRLPNVVHWVAVDLACRDRLLNDENIAPPRLSLLLNHFDERKFFPGNPLPPMPGKALIISNYLTADSPAVAVIAALCEARGLELTTAGARFGRPIEKMESFLPGYDLVFAKARTAIEALAVGCAVIQVDYFGAGRLVSSENYEELRERNFGFASMRFPITAEHLGAEMDRYDAADAGRVSARIRQEATLANTMQALEILYQQAAAQTSSLADYDPAQAAADFLRFQLLLSKDAMNGIPKAPGVPLRLPAHPIPAGKLAAEWIARKTPHLESAKTARTEKNERRQTSEVEKAEKRERLRRQLTALKARQSDFRAKTAARLEHARLQVAALTAENAHLKAKAKAKIERLEAKISASRAQKTPGRPQRFRQLLRRIF